MELADNPRLDLPSSCKVQGIGEEIDSGKISVIDESNELQYTTKPESFVIDIDSFSNSTGKEISKNSRITLQRNYSRKGQQRGGNKVNHDYAADTRDSISPSPIGGSVVEVGGSSTLEKQDLMGLGSRDQMGGSAQSHQIAMSTTAVAERCSIRRNSFKRSPQPQGSWYLNPKKVFLCCATLSCVGTMLLIYYAFSSGMLTVDEFDY